MRSEDAEFHGGPLDGRVLSVLLGATSRPPRIYTVPVPGGDGRPEAVHVYRLAPVHGPRRGRWRYEYDPEGRPAGPRRFWPGRSRRTGA